MAKKIVTTIEKPIVEPIEQTVDIAQEPTNIEVTLVDQSYSSVISNGCIIDFTDGKAIVSTETADKLKEQGLIA
jgi:hypothetical protein